MPVRPTRTSRLFLAHIRLFLIRYRLVYWTVAITCALLAGFTVHQHQVRAERAAHAWGERTPVLVLSRSVAIGHDLRADDVTSVLAPIALAPPSRMGELPPDAIARSDLARGSIVVAEMVIEPGGGLDGRHRGVALPIVATTPPLHPGRSVDLITTGTVLSAGSVVLSVDDTQVVVAVPVDEVARVTAAARVDDVTVVLS
ncbi:MAG: hypothetical protein ACR2QE_13035 [Acidimicrobiales bacterium]